MSALLVQLVNRSGDPVVLNVNDISAIAIGDASGNFSSSRIYMMSDPKAPVTIGMPMLDLVEELKKQAPNAWSIPAPEVSVVNKSRNIKI